MTTLAEIRRKYPGAYDDMTDAQLSNALYNKHYSDMDRSAFDAKIGYAEPQTQPEAQAAPSTDRYSPDNLPAFMQNPVGRAVSGAAGKLDSATQAVTRGLTAGFNDELNALPALMPGGQTYGEAREGLRQNERDAQQRNPVTFGAAEISGGLAGVGRVGTSLKGLKGAAASAGVGATYGAGTADGDMMDRLRGAAMGGALGAGGFAAVSGAGKALAPLLKAKPKPQGDLPSLDDLKALTKRLYNEADQQGASYSPEQLSALYQGVSDEISTTGLGRITPRTHPTTNAMLRQMKGQGDAPASLTELDRLRRLSGSANVTNPDDQRLSGFIRQNIDEFTDNTPPSSGGNAASILKQARAANTRLRKSEQIDEALVKAGRRADSTGSGGNWQNASRQNIRRILDSKKLRRGFTPEEIAQMEKVVRGTPGQNLLRTIGKLSPEGNGLMTMLGIGGAAINPAMGAASGGGFIAKRASDRAATQSIDDLIRLVRTGQSMAPVATRGSQAVTDPLLQSILARSGTFAAIP